MNLQIEKIFFRSLLLLLVLLASAKAFGATPTDTPTATGTRTLTNTATYTRSNTPTSTPSRTPTVTPTGTTSATPNGTLTNTSIVTPTATPATYTQTPTPSPTRTPTASMTKTPMPFGTFCEDWDGGSTSFGSWNGASQNGTFPGPLSLVNLGAPSNVGLRLNTAPVQWSSATLSITAGSWADTDFSAVILSGNRGTMMTRMVGGITDADSGCLNCYVFQVEVGGALALWVVSGGAETYLATLPIAPVNYPFSMRMVVSDTLVQGYLNGASTPSISASGSFGAIPSGAVGVMAYDGPTVYDNIQVNAACSFAPILATMTFTRSPTRTRTVTNPPTQTTSPTITASPTPGGMNSGVVDDFEDGDTITTHGGGFITYFGLFGNCLYNISSGGCSYGTPDYRCNLFGNVVQGTGSGPYVFTQFQFLPGGAACNPGEFAGDHCFNFSFRNNTPGRKYRICLDSAAVLDGDQYCFDYTPSGTGWQSLSIYFPDVAAAPGINRFAQAGTGTPVSWSNCLQSLRGTSIGCVGESGGPVSFDIDVDDMHFGPAITRSNPIAVAAAFGTTLANVINARSLAVDEFMEWVILRLAVYCGCTPYDIMQMRDTMSWGEIAVAVGSSWAAIIAQVNSMAGAAAINPASSHPGQIRRTISNHPLQTPIPIPAPYVPAASLSVFNSPYPGCQ